MTTYVKLPDEMRGTTTFIDGILATTGIDAAATLNLGYSTATAVVLGNSANTVTTNIYGATVDIGQAGSTVKINGTLNNVYSTNTYVQNALEVDGVIYADGGIDVDDVTDLAIGATNATTVSITPATTVTGILTASSGVLIDGGAAAAYTIAKVSSELRIGGDGTNGGSLDAGTTPVVEWTSSAISLNKPVTVSSAIGGVTSAAVLTTESSSDVAIHRVYSDAAAGVSGVVFDNATTSNAWAIANREGDSTLYISRTPSSLNGSTLATNAVIGITSSAISLNKPVTVAATSLEIESSSTNSLFTMDRNTSGAFGIAIGVNQAEFYAGASGSPFGARFLIGNSAGAVTIGPSGNTSAHTINGPVTITHSAGTGLLASAGTVAGRFYRGTSSSNLQVLAVQSNVGGTQQDKWQVDTDGDAATLSDQRLKTDLGTFSGLDLISLIMPRYYKMKDGDKIAYGYFAQELEKVVPEAVKVGETEDDLWMVKYEYMHAIHTKAIQELAAQNDELRARIATLEGA